MLLKEFIIALASQNIHKLENSKLLLEKGYDKCSKQAKLAEKISGHGCEDGWTPQKTGVRGKPDGWVASGKQQENVCLKGLGESTWDDDLCEKIGAKRLYFTSSNGNTFFKNGFHKQMKGKGTLGHTYKRDL